LNKEFNLIHLNKKRQLLYFIKEFALSLKEYNKFLLKQNSSLKNKVINLELYYKPDLEKLKIYYNNYNSVMYFNYFNDKNYDLNLNSFRAVTDQIFKAYASNIFLANIITYDIAIDKISLHCLLNAFNHIIRL
jgi:hypothetical protein